MIAKACRTCGETKPLTAAHWYRQTRAKTGFQSYCKTCMAGWNAARWRRMSPDPRPPKISRDERRRRQRERARRLRETDGDALRLAERVRRYNITSAEYLRLFDAQKNACAICRTTEARHSRFWHVDHCHASGKVRGILCSTCNVMLAQAHDNPEKLRAGAAYLEERL